VRNGNLDEGMMDAWRSIRAWGVRPVVYDGVETSNIFGNRVILERAIEEARRLGAILVAPSRDRIIRSQCFGPGKTAKVEQPSVHEYEYLLQLANGVVLATLLPPDERGHSSQVRRGQAAKGRKGGRPRKKNPGEVKDRRLRLTPLAIKKLSSGMSQRATSAALGIAESTLRGWIKGWAVTDSEG
jgi:DNA invertase Pin-like site-specific DNA recombinase